MYISLAFMIYNNHLCPPVLPSLLVGVNHISQATTHCQSLQNSCQTISHRRFACWCMHTSFFSYGQSTIPWCLISESEIHQHLLSLRPGIHCKNYMLPFSTVCTMFIEGQEYHWTCIQLQNQHSKQWLLYCTQKDLRKM